MANTSLQTMFKGVTAISDLYEKKTQQELYDQDADQISGLRRNAYFLFDEFQKSATELKVAIVIGFSLSVLVFLGSWVMTLRAFRVQALQARRGYLTWRAVDPEAKKLWAGKGFTAQPN